MSFRPREYHHQCEAEDCRCQIETTPEFRCLCSRYFCHIHKRRYIDGHGYVCDDCGERMTEAEEGMTDVDV